MIKQQHKLARLYLNKAAEDQILMDKILDDEQISDDIFGFHAQQAIEKLLKAGLTHLEIRVGKTHDLRRLMDDLAGINHPLPDKLTKLDVLTPYGVAGRYGELPFKHPFSRKELKEMVRELRRFIEGLLL